jgi:catechol 2,3-dioxygenase-like lactoylglutathione lyase family enzyme
MIIGINHLTLAVKDIEKSFDFYRNVLDLRPLCKWDKGAYFLAGDFWLCLNLDPKRIPNECYTHYAFSISQDNFKKASKRIIASGTKIFKENTSPGDSLYFLDPDGHKLEIHTEHWESRIQTKKIDSGTWRHIEWFV